MVYNQDLPRYNTADIIEHLKRWKESKNDATNSAIIAENGKVACTINRASFNSIITSRITAELWRQR